MVVVELGRIPAASLGKEKSPVVHTTPPQASLATPSRAETAFPTRRMADRTRAEGTGQGVVGWRWQGVVTGGLVTVAARDLAQGETEGVL